MNTTPAIRELLNVDWFAYRMIRDAITEATAAGWIRRAERYEAQACAPAGYPGQSTAQERNERRLRAANIANMCRHRATLCESTPELDALIEYEQWTCGAVARLMRDVDDCESIGELRSVWSEARSTGVLDMDHPLHKTLATHFDNAANRLKAVREVAA